MATLDSVKFASYVFGQFGYDLAAFWVTYTGADSLMVEMLLGDLLKIALGPLVLVILFQKCKQVVYVYRVVKVSLFILLLDKNLAFKQERLVVDQNYWA